MEPAQVMGIVVGAFVAFLLLICFVFNWETTLTVIVMLVVVVAALLLVGYVMAVIIFNSWSVWPWQADWGH